MLKPVKIPTASPGPFAISTSRRAIAAMGVFEIFTYASIPQMRVVDIAAISNVHYHSEK